jgi:Protein of unknown function (DUF998)
MKTDKKWIGNPSMGYITIVIYLLFTIVSACFNLSLVDPINHWVSDLGNSTLNPKGAVIYNIGCMLTGSLLMLFFIGLKDLQIDNEVGKKFLKLMILVGIILSFADIMIGVFSEDTYDEHVFWSVTFFILLLPTLLFGGIILSKYANFSRVVCIYGMILAGINILFLFFYIPVFEWITIFSSLSFVGVISYNYPKENHNS